MINRFTRKDKNKAISTLPTLYIFLAGLTTALFTTLITFMFVKIRLEYELTARLSSQIYIFDFMLAFIASLYIVDSLNVVNGLF